MLPGLVLPCLLVGSASLDEFFVGSLVNQFSRIENENGVGVSESGESIGDKQCGSRCAGPALFGTCLQGIDEFLFCFMVDCG